MSEIKKINVGGVDYDIVSESAEKKIAELEKNNTALASVTFGTTITDEPIKVNFGADPDPINNDIYIGKEVYLGTKVVIGTKYPVHIGWQDNGSLTIMSEGGNRGAITIGSNVNIQVGSGSGNVGIKGVVQIDSGSELHMSSSTINMYDSHLTLDGEGLHFGTEDGHIGNNVGITLYGDAIELRQGFRNKCRFHADACDIYIGSNTNDERKGLIVRECGAQILEIGNAVYIGHSLNIGSCVYIGDFAHIGSHVTIGGNLSSEERLNIHGPVFLEAKTGETALTIGTDGVGALKIDWSGDRNAITFTHVRTGKKATLTLA